MSRGSRNLLLLGAGSMLFAAVMTSISLTIYKETGDIYLDRSRPGFLPDEEEVEKESEASTNYQFSDSGALDQKELNTYLEELKKLKERLDERNSYLATPLTDESLGINELAPSVEKTN